ncbi:map-kinase activating death domain protein, putative [Ixodes scapularis]|uniref:MAP kinase-activating death domain protein n=1 Tax=Ixodes scapularis TaxID=6945 RepID=B7P802_IXOSC|nr:map-kinase activating death domain protein, putative [Ixodes scapularis]|eukprot:XP_002400464.1 map-kinase activating death domain protein, putative [Ixodes scapularis]
MDVTRKYFSPRLLDYIVITGARQPSRTTPVQPPELLRRYPTEDHPDFPLPLDVVFFCQPEGCILLGARRTSLRESTPFVFALTEKDTSRVRYGICVNFYRPIDRADGFPRGSGDQSSFEGGDVVLPPEAGPAPPVPARRKRLSSHSLVSLCIISHHPFFSTFRECLFTLRKLLDSSNERLLSISMCISSLFRDSVWNVFLGRVVEGISSAVLHEVREIETWMLRLLSAPVPVPGKTRVEVAILPRSVERPLVFALPDHTRFSLVDFPLHLPLELLGVDTCMKVLTCIILEHKARGLSRDYNALSMSVMAFVTMIYPLEYMFPVIPLLPTCMASAEQLLLAPTPYIIGVPATFFKLKRSFCLPDDVWLVDLDSNSVIKPPGVEDLPPLPEPEGSHLLYHLKQAGFSSSHLQTSLPIGNLDKIQPRAAPGASSLPEKPEQQPPPLSGFNPLIYGNDVDSVDVATRIAMVRFFNSVGVLAHFMEHTRTLRLYPRPVVAFQVNSFLHSRAKLSTFLRKFVRTQAVEFYAEWSLCPTNVAFLRVHTGVFDPAVIGDKGKWYCHQLEPIYFDVWSESCTLTTSMAAMGLTDEASTGESGSESDDASSTSSSYSSLSDFVCDMVEFNGENVGESSSGGAETPRECAGHFAVPYPYCLTQVQGEPSEGGDNDAPAGGGSSNDGEPHTPSTIRSGPSRSPVGSVSSGRSTPQRGAPPLPPAGPWVPWAAWPEGCSAGGPAAAASPPRGAREKQDPCPSESSSEGQFPTTQLSFPRRDSGSLITTMSNELNGFAAHTSNVIQGISGLFGERSNLFPSFLHFLQSNTLLLYWCTAASFIYERQFRCFGSLCFLFRYINSIKNYRRPGTKFTQTQCSSDNQQFLKEVLNAIRDGEGVKWFKQSRIRRLMEDESYRNLVVSQLNRTLERRVGPDGLIKDVMISKPVYKGTLKMLQMVISGLEQSYTNYGLGGMAKRLAGVRDRPYTLLEQGRCLRTGAAHQPRPSPSESLIRARGPARARVQARQPEPRLPLTPGPTSTRASWSSPTLSSLAMGLKSRGHKTQKLQMNRSSILVCAVLLCCMLVQWPDSHNVCSVNPNFVQHFVSRELSHLKYVIISAVGSVSDTGSVTMNPAFFRQTRGGSNASFRSTVSDSEVEAGGTGSVSMPSDTRPSRLGRRSLDGGRLASVSCILVPVFCRNQRYLVKNRSTLWDEPQFWEDTFFDAVSQERNATCPDRRCSCRRYRTLSSPEKKRLEHEEDRLLSTLLSNVIAFMLMMEVNIEEIRRRARRLLGKCHISLVYSAELNTLLDALEDIVGKCLILLNWGDSYEHAQRACLLCPNDGGNDGRRWQVRDDGLVLRAANGHVLERWWYERLVNMSYCPKNKVLCLWRRSQGQTQLHKYYTRKCKDMYYSIKEAMERAAARGKVVTSGTELGGEFPVLDMTTREGGILQVCMEGVGLLFANSKFFVRLENIKRCYTQREHIFVLEEYNPKTRHTIERRYESKMASEICYAVLCVFSYLISGDPRPAQPGAGSSRS